MLTSPGLNYFRDPNFLQLDVKAGVIRTKAGTRMIGVNEDFLKGFVAAVEYECGPAATVVLRKCGAHFGKRLGERFEADLFKVTGMSTADRPMMEFDFLVRDMWEQTGMGLIDIDWEKGQHGFLPVKLEHSPMQDIGPKGHEGDDMFTGIIEGFIIHFADAAMRCIQTGDMRLGSKDGTTFIVGFEDKVAKAESMAQDGTRHRDIVEALS